MDRRFSKVVPLWIRCLLLGLALSWIVAVCHWFFVEIGALSRYRHIGASQAFVHPDEDVSGIAAVEWVDRRLRGAPPRGSDLPVAFERYHAIAYGKPDRAQLWRLIYAQYGQHRVGKLTLETPPLLRKTRLHRSRLGARARSSTLIHTNAICQSSPSSATR